MTAAFDATFLLYLFRDAGTVQAPIDLATGQRVTMPKERVEGLLADLQKTGTKIIVATPALSEIMVRVGVSAAQQYVAIMSKVAAFRIAPFDTKAAIECALMHGHSTVGEGGQSATPGTHAKLKYDRQIVAIAKTEGAIMFYTDDLDQRRFAERQG
ncbi:MAG TPA: hypothetical protein VGI95_02265 [Caulobacteraceae bacterium]